MRPRARALRAGESIPRACVTLVSSTGPLDVPPVPETASMSASHLIACLLSAVGLAAAAAGDLQRPEGRVFGGPGAGGRVGGAPAAVVTFGGVWPPGGSTSSARLFGMRAGGLNLATA